MAVGVPMEESNATGVNGIQSDKSVRGAGAVYLYAVVQTTLPTDSNWSAADEPFPRETGATKKIAMTGVRAILIYRW